MLISGCVKYHVLIYERCKINPSKLERIKECGVVYNHWSKSTKIGYGWHIFAQLQNLEAGTQIIFEFLDATSNFILF